MNVDEPVPVTKLHPRQEGVLVKRCGYEWFETSAGPHRFQEHGYVVYPGTISARRHCEDDVPPVGMGGCSHVGGDYWDSMF